MGKISGKTIPGTLSLSLFIHEPNRLPGEKASWVKEIIAREGYWPWRLHLAGSRSEWDLWPDVIIHTDGSITRRSKNPQNISRIRAATNCYPPMNLASSWI